ncbi:MAG: hypothetical protein K6G65_06330 [Lachnospiraceae bacterium]|nr:hypothetical protein [Lachnospiraceae bacterium]
MDERWNELVKPRRCNKCHGALKTIEIGKYRCTKCGEEMLDNYGKVREYIREYGSAPAVEISEATGVPTSEIKKYLQEGRLEYVPRH